MPNFQNYINTGILLEAMICSSEMSMLLLDKDGIIREMFNPKIFNKLGYSYAYPFVGQSVFDIIEKHTDDKISIQKYKDYFNKWMVSPFTNDTLIGEEKILKFTSNAGDEVSIRGLLSKIELKNSIVLNDSPESFQGVVVTVVALEGISKV